jgi:hypothetical protein
MLLRMSSLNPVEFSVRVTSPSEANYTAEARSIQAAAAARRTHVVKLEQIVFFSTSTGDAWMLDSVDRSAACLAREGEILPIFPSSRSRPQIWPSDGVPIIGSTARPSR